MNSRRHVPVFILGHRRPLCGRLAKHTRFAKTIAALDCEACKAVLVRQLDADAAHRNRHALVGRSFASGQAIHSRDFARIARPYLNYDA